MIRALARGALGTVLATLFVGALGGGALAYFSGGGSGSAAAAVSALGAPQLSSTKAAPSMVSLSWSEVASPGAGSVRYYVSRNGGEPGGSCSGQSNPAASLSCVDMEVPAGKHTYEVTAVWKSWSAKGEAKAVTVSVGEASKFTISASNAVPTAGEDVDLTIAARDAGNGVVTSYTGNKTLVFSGAEASPKGTKPTVVNRSGSAILFGSNASITFTAGVASVSSNRNGVLRAYKAGPTAVQATQGSITTPAPLELTVAPASAAELALAAASSTQTAGAGNDLTVTARDEYGNTASSYVGSKSVTFSGASASPGGSAATVADSAGKAVAFGSATALQFVAGVAKPEAGANGTMTIYRSGSASVKATQGSLETPSAATLTVSPATAAKLVLSASSTTPAAAGSFNLTTTARDPYENTATSYTGTKSLVFSGSEASPNANFPTVVNSSGTAVAFGGATALTFNSGVASVSSSKNGLTRLYRAGEADLGATDGTIATEAPLAIAVSPGSASRVALDGLTASAGSIGSPCLFACTVTGLGNPGTISSGVAITDSSGNVVANLGSAKTVTVTVSKGGTIGGGTLTVPKSGAAVAATDFLYTAPSSGSFTHTITAASSGYTSATATASR